MMAWFTPTVLGILVTPNCYFGVGLQWRDQRGGFCHSECNSHMFVSLFFGLFDMHAA